MWPIAWFQLSRDSGFRLKLQAPLTSPPAAAQLFAWCCGSSNRNECINFDPIFKCEWRAAASLLLCHSPRQNAASGCCVELLSRRRKRDDSMQKLGVRKKRKGQTNRQTNSRRHEAAASTFINCDRQRQCRKTLAGHRGVVGRPQA